VKRKKMTKISVEDIPANVMETVDKIMPGGTVEKAGKLEIKDKVIYKVKKAVEAGSYVIKVTADGDLLAVIREDLYRKMWKHRAHPKCPIKHKARSSHHKCHRKHHKGHGRKEKE